MNIVTVTAVDYLSLPYIFATIVALYSDKDHSSLSEAASVRLQHQ